MPTHVDTPTIKGHHDLSPYTIDRRKFQITSRMNNASSVCGEGSGNALQSGAPLLPERVSR
jgi:hypothetical protein